MLKINLAGSVKIAAKQTNSATFTGYGGDRMRIARRCAAIMIASVAAALPAGAQQAPVLVQGSLVAPGSEPFHLKATITEDHDASPKATIEIFWLAPDRWRRTIESPEFSQTVIVNGDRKFDKHSDDYFPLGLNTLATAMVDPQPILNAYAAGDHILTKANGQSDESGVTCFDPRRRMCVRSPFGLMESIGIGNHYVDFSNYEEFGGKRVARRLVYNISVGDFLIARVVELKPLRNPAGTLFTIDQPTPAAAQLETAIYNESDLRSHIIGQAEVIWPQVLDGAVTGNATFYLAIDPGGRVREVLLSPLRMNGPTTQRFVRSCAGNSDLRPKTELPYRQKA